MRKGLLLPAAALAMAVMPMSAMANRPGYGFVRVEAGSAELEVAAGGDEVSDRDTAYSVRGGYYFSPNFAVEGFYTDFGSPSKDGASVSLDGFGAGIAAKHNFGDDDLGFFVGGRAGVMRSKAEFAVTGAGSASDDSVHAYAGVGVGYDFSPTFGLSLQYDYTKAKPSFAGEDIDVKAQALTLGGEFRF
jgi:OmpA-OmpF porin, OOP family